MPAMPVRIARISEKSNAITALPKLLEAGSLGERRTIRYMQLPQASRHLAATRLMHVKQAGSAPAIALLTSQRKHGSRIRRFHRATADGDPGNAQRNGTAADEYHRRQVDAVGEVFQPGLHGKVSERPRDQVRDQHQ